MEEQEYPTDFSPLYKYLQSDTSIQSDTLLDHPFSFYTSDYSILDTTLNLSDFNHCIRYQQTILKMGDYAYSCFLLEISLLQEKKQKYLNHIISFLLEQYDTSQKSDVILANSIRQLFYKICESQFNIYINSSNRYRLSKWHTLREPIKSFVLKKIYEDKWFYTRIFRSLVDGSYRYKFIAEDTSFTSFKALFEGKYLENKINWIENKSSLIYFIKSLIAKEKVKNPKNKHWEIVSEFFLLKGEPLQQSELLNQKETTNKEKKRMMDYIVNFF